MIIEKKLSNGVTLIAEKLPYFRSLSLGFWIGTGSVKEAKQEAGMSHFIEHMLFKGTEKRTSQEIAAQMDGIGAQINAFTAKECTCYYAKALEEHTEISADVLSDLVLHSSFDPAEMKKEKGVVIEEIAMVEDSPEDLAQDLLSSTYFSGHPLGAPILGTKESVESFTRESLMAYMDKHYTPDNIIIAAAGCLDENKLTDCIEKSFDAKPCEECKKPYPDAPKLEAKRHIAREKDVEQVHISLALPGYPIDDGRYFPLLVLNNILGGSMSSRLFQKIREEKGMAYSVYSYTSSYRNTGMLGLYAGTNANQAQTVLELMLEEMRLLIKDGITDGEFTRSKEQLKGNYILGSESPGARMMSIGKSKLLNGRIFTEEETVSRIEAVTMEGVRDVIPQSFNFDLMTAAFVGRLNGKADEWSKMW